MNRNRLLLLLPIAGATLLFGFRAPLPPGCDAGNGGLTVPAGFCASLFAEVGAPRHLAVAPNGDVFVATQGRGDGNGGVVAMRDRNGDGKADTTARFGTGPGTGIALAPDAIYFAPHAEVVRYRWKPGTLVPADAGTVIVRGMPTGGHTAKTIAVGRSGEIYVDHGSLSNVCVVERTARAAGQMPCEELPTRAGIWRYNATRAGQTPADGERWVTGFRNGMAIAVEPTSGMLWGATHGRDALASWGFSAEDNAEKPAEEFGMLAKGSDYGWPYCYYDPITKKKVQAPEYGGDGVAQGECATKTQPVIGFPGHWAPLQLAFNTGEGFGRNYRGGAFLAFRGSWNRAPLPQAGHRIVYIPFAKGRATGAYTTFLTGAGADIKFSGVAMQPDGRAMYVSSDQAGKVWRIIPIRGK
ncbi:MAG: PQQ-dependent sugar dehydrogenase [Gemmatimonadales bacterium]